MGVAINGLSLSLNRFRLPTSCIIRLPIKTLENRSKTDRFQLLGVVLYHISLVTINHLSALATHQPNDQPFFSQFSSPMVDIDYDMGWKLNS